MGRSNHRKFAARYIAADRLHRDILMAKNDTRQGFHLNIRHACALRLCKAAYLSLREFDIFHIARRNLVHSGLDLAIRQAKIFRGICIELL